MSRTVTPPAHMPSRWLRWSLAALWLWTALASLLDPQQVGPALLAHQHVLPGWSHSPLIMAGAGVDAVIGLWMLWCPGRPVWALAAAMTVLMSLMATWIEPTLWWHPLGPLTKNLPIVAMLAWLYTQDA